MKGAASKPPAKMKNKPNLNITAEMAYNRRLMANERMEDGAKSFIEDY